jgi:cytochrome P450
LINHDAPEHTRLRKIVSRLFTPRSVAALEEQLAVAAREIVAAAAEKGDGNVILLVVAGNETSRNAMTRGMTALLENPSQWDLFKRDRPATTADEIANQVPEISKVAEPQRLRSSWINGVKELRISYSG